MKNGAHCAFAHGPADLRQPVYDIRELQAMEQEEKGENRQIIPEDPRWNGMSCSSCFKISQFNHSWFCSLALKVYFIRVRFSMLEVLVFA